MRSPDFRAGVRVVHLVSNLDTFGGERFTASLVVAQRAERDGIGVITFSPPDAVSERLGAICLPRRRLDVRFLLRLVRELKAIRPDVVHTHLEHAKHWGRLAALIAGVPVTVHTEHGNGFGQSGVRRVLAAILHRYTTFIVALSEAQRERIACEERADPARVRVIANGISTAGLGQIDRADARRELGVSDDVVMLLTVARLDPEKGHALSIEALVDVPAHVHLFLAGVGRLDVQLRALARARGVADRVHFLGYRRDRARLLAAADAYLCSSSDETMPLALIEAMCAGLPILSTAWMGADELLAGAVSQIVRSRAPADLAASIGRYVTPDWRERAARLALAQREHWDICGVARRYLSLYDEAVATRRAAS